MRNLFLAGPADDDGGEDRLKFAGSSSSEVGDGLVVCGPGGGGDVGVATTTGGVTEDNLIDGGRSRCSGEGAAEDGEEVAVTAEGEEESFRLLPGQERSRGWIWQSLLIIFVVRLCYLYVLEGGFS